MFECSHRPTVNGKLFVSLLVKVVEYLKQSAHFSDGVIKRNCVIDRCWHYDDPIVEEATNVLREWGAIWTRFYVVSRRFLTRWLSCCSLALDHKDDLIASRRSKLHNYA